jgi:hypothetical protein
MGAIADIEIEEWCGEHAVPLGGSSRAVPAYPYTARITYSDGRKSGREAGVAQQCAQALGTWDECLLWVVEWGVWASGEDWPKFYAARGRRGARISLEAAPGHLFAADEAADLVEFMTLVMENAWDAQVLPVAGGVSTGVRAYISHDEWVALHGEKPVVFTPDPKSVTGAK